ncbi:hypothetical protein AgCh_016964 [Apium graveolens]
MMPMDQLLHPNKDSTSFQGWLFSLARYERTLRIRLKRHMITHNRSESFHATFIKNKIAKQARLMRKIVILSRKLRTDQGLHPLSALHIMRVCSQWPSQILFPHPAPKLTPSNDFGPETTLPVKLMPAKRPLPGPSQPDQGHNDNQPRVPCLTNKIESALSGPLMPNDVAGSRNNRTSWTPVHKALPLYFGPPTHMCMHCSAMLWYEERIKRNRHTANPQFTFYCMEGRVKLPLLKDPPPLLKHLLGPRSGKHGNKFRRNIRPYNSIFAMASMGVQVDKLINKSRGPYVFRAGGQIYHNTSSLLSPIGKKPLFAQLYIYDTDHEITNKISTMRNPEKEPAIDESIVQGLTKMLDEHSNLVRSYRKARDMFEAQPHTTFHLRLPDARTRDGREYNIPTESEVGGLIVGELTEKKFERDIIVHHRTKGITHIDELHPSYMSMAYPLIHPYGEDGHRLGPDRATAVIEGTDERDEIKTYLDCRYISACESCWRIFQFSINYRYPTVERLPFHLPGEHTVIFEENRSIDNVLNVPGIEKTKFTEWLETNRMNEDARNLTYVEFPRHWVWNFKGKLWTRRKKGKAVGRIYYTHPASGERFYMRMLLNFVRGSTSFECIRTINGITYPTFKAACYALGLLDDDKEWIDCLSEAAIWGTGNELRNLFVTILIFCQVSNIPELWKTHSEILSENMLHLQRKRFQVPNLQLTKKQIESYALMEIEALMQKLGKSLKDIDGMPQPDPSLTREFGNRLLSEEMDYDRVALKILHDRSLSALNHFQKKRLMTQLCTSFSMMRANYSSLAAMVAPIGDGSLYDLLHQELIRIPYELCKLTSNDPMQDIVNEVYPLLLESYKDPAYLKECAILTPKNETVHELNDFLMNMIPGKERTYLSSDSVCKASVKADNDDLLYPIEFLNSLKFSGVPNHDIRLKEGTPIMLLRNLNQSGGLCNGTRLIVTRLGKWSIRGDIISGTKAGQNVTIPRIIMSPKESKWPFKLNRRQLPVAPYFAMTINKSQGQSLKRVGLYPPNQVFTHGQVYVALSRVTARDGLVIVNADSEVKDQHLIKNILYKEVKDQHLIKNIVYKEVFNNIQAPTRDKDEHIGGLEVDDTTG